MYGLEGREHIVRFGTSGLRGLVSEMTDARCAGYVSAFLDYLAKTHPTFDKVLIGRDLRPSSWRISQACRAAIIASGREATDCGVLPTPALALEASRLKAPAVMVTGSHIPFDRNGLKFYRADGEITKVDEAGIRSALKDAVDRELPITGDSAEDDSAQVRYMARADAYPEQCLTGMRIGIYQHSAAGRDLTNVALSRLGAKTIPLGRSDTFVPIDTEAVSVSARTQIAAWVEEHHLDALVSTDGDGDRPLLGDDTGQVLRGDTLGLLAARYLCADVIVTPVSSTTAIERSGWFSRIIRTRIGSPYVIEGLQAAAADGAHLPVGFEANGGFILAADAVVPSGGNLTALPTRDALVPLLSVLAMARQVGKPISALAAELPRRATASDRLPEIDSTVSTAFLKDIICKASARETLLSAIGSPAVRSLDLTDGIRLTLDSGEIVHLRASGNAPELRCYAEADTAGAAEALVARILAQVAACLRST